MKKENKKNIIIALLIVVNLAIIALLILVINGTINFKDESNNNVINNRQEETDNNDQEQEIQDNKEELEKETNDNEYYIDENTSNEEETSNWLIEEEAKQYITLEDVSLTEEVSTKKVKFINIDGNLTKQFYADQQAIIDNIHIYNDEYIKGGADYKLKAFVNNNILSVVYLIEEQNAIGTCGTKMAVTNIDIVNDQVISEEELLNKANTSYNKLVTDYYNSELVSWKKLNEYNKTDIDYYDVTFKDFSNNKDKYVNIGLAKLPDIIYTYIENGQIKYDYYTIDIGTLFHPVGKGGCFNWATTTLGEYK